MGFATALRRHAKPSPQTWNRPLLALTITMAVFAVVALIMSVTDSRMLLGQNIWFKPVKFALSIAVYALSLAWLLQSLPRFSRTAHWLGTIAAAGLAIEIAIIASAAAIGERSHFNVATPVASALYSIMASSIVIVWLVTLAVGIATMFVTYSDRARALAIRSGVLLGLIGMALAFLMTAPQPGQVENFAGIIGAHTVGAADGGPGIPFLGWSTEAGDLRAPHFMGMHALQVLPLSLFIIELLATRCKPLSDETTRTRLVQILALSYAAALALLTVQALRGEPVTAPSVTTLVIAAAITVTATTAIAVALTRPTLRE